MYCQNCGKELTGTTCPYCGQIAEPQTAYSTTTQTVPPGSTIIINNTNTNSNINTNTNMNANPMGIRKNKWVAFVLCLFLGFLGAHKFYEGKIGTGIVYMFTMGIFGIGWLVDILSILCKPNPYYVYWA